MAENKLEHFFSTRKEKEKYQITDLRDHVLNDIGVIPGTVISELLMYNILQLYIQQRKDLVQVRGRNGGITLLSDTISSNEE